MQWLCIKSNLGPASSTSNWFSLEVAIKLFGNVFTTPYSMDYLIISGIQIAISEDIKLMGALNLSLLNLRDELLFQSDITDVWKMLTNLFYSYNRMWDDCTANIVGKSDKKKVVLCWYNFLNLSWENIFLLLIALWWKYVDK